MGASSPWGRVGQVTGLAGTALLALSFVLATRAQWLEDYFGGLDQMYRTHHAFGLTAFGVLAAHPVALALRFIPEQLSRALLFLMPVHRQLAVNVGVYALWGLVALVALTLARRVPYDTWKITHRGLGVVLLLGAAHMLAVRPTRGYDVALAQVPGLWYYMLGLTGLGLVSAAYVSVWKPLFGRRLPCRVTGVHRLSKEVVEVELTPETGRLDFFPGQYVFVSFRGEGLTRESHPFTVCSPAGEHAFRVTVKALGDFTSTLYGRLREGMAAQVDGPYGRFDYRQGGSDQIWIAGGVGIAPFLSWARHMAHTEDHLHAGDRAHAGNHEQSVDLQSVDLYYCVHSRGDAVYRDELKALSETIPGLRVRLVCSVEEGHLQVGDLGDLSGKDVFLCGPARLTGDFRRTLRRRGVERERIHFEDFEFRASA
jgi:predicted ferric reductase